MGKYLAYPTSQQIGWYRIRNQMLVADHRAGMTMDELKEKYALSNHRINQIIKECGE